MGYRQRHRRAGQGRIPAEVEQQYNDSQQQA
jgi:hypothetical protein